MHKNGPTSLVFKQEPKQALSGRLTPTMGAGAEGRCCPLSEGYLCAHPATPFVGIYPEATVSDSK